MPSAKLNNRLALNKSPRMHGSDDLVPMALQDILLRTREIILRGLGGKLVENPESGLTI